MRRLVYPLALAALAALAAPAARAQAVLDVRATCDTGATNTFCNTAPRSVFRVDDSGGVVAVGTLGIGVIPATGGGERMMWHPYKAAFRAGSVGQGGTQWDDANVGFYSASFGYNTVALGLAAFSAGYNSRAFGYYSTAIGYSAVGGGTGAVAIGYRATANADNSVAIGYRATVNGFVGAIVLADASTTDSIRATAVNQFTVRAAGGYRLFTNAAMNVGVSLAPGGSAWQVVSDRNRKEDFEAVDTEALLQRVARLPLSTWHYRDTETTDRHVGPMAQDWQAAVDDVLGLNSDSLTINQGDFDGVNLAAIQALEARTRRLAEENEALHAELDALRAARTAAAARFARVEAALARLAEEAPTGPVLATVTTGGELRP